MNILYLNSHDSGRCIQPYGYGVRTPNLQALAADGVTFRDAHAAAPTCSPSRCALTFGQYPHVAGLLGLGHRGFRPRDHCQHLAHTLAAAGYDTATWGIQDNHVGTDGGFAQVGYAEALDGGHEAIGSWLRARAGQRQPFFLSASWFLTHRRGPGFGTPRLPADDPRWLRPPVPLADTPVLRADWAHFCSDAAQLDQEIGGVLAALDEAGLAEDTLVIATTDHGIAFPGMKCSLTSQGTGVFLILRGPGGWRGGRVVESLVSQIDLYPTICRLAGVAVPDFCQGEDLAPCLDDPARRLHEAIYAEVSYHAAYEPKRARRDGRWLYIRRWGERRLPVRPNCDISPSKDAWLAAGWDERDLPEEELYDCLLDPAEARDLAREPAFAGEVARQRAALAEWMAATDDPLCQGAVPLPAGAWANPPEGLDPNNSDRITG